MWKEVPIDRREVLINMAAHLMKNPIAFEAACRMAVDQWPNSTGSAMTTPSMNYQAWIGHAGCALSISSPEHLTRQGWRLLNEQEQDAANAAADRAIEYWRSMNA